MWYQLKLFSVVFLLICYFLGMLRPVAPLVKYQLMKSYYMKVLCQQRDRVINTCQGTCQLKKEIKEEASKPGKLSFFVDFEKYPIGFVHFIELEKTSCKESSLRYFSFAENGLSSHLYSIFHPPQFC
ncbi:hypothetical protein R9C00_11395 [Flammeovirgaceae bacterium SG7u.111]|nr:hypothetical protein [Flammeovirgaceae bacterium SG7u.132]WPO38056.1 hypothetical protein R9C00_11395 [Flammeovirgaceae bacterium SG7u.111]